MRPEQGMQAETLVHEILHGCIEDSGISLPEKKEERLIRALSPRLAAFMADNKDVVREILKAL